MNCSQVSPTLWRATFNAWRRGQGSGRKTVTKRVAGILGHLPEFFFGLASARFQRLIYELILGGSEIDDELSAAFPQSSLDAHAKLNPLLGCLCYSVSLFHR